MKPCLQRQGGDIEVRVRHVVGSPNETTQERAKAYNITMCCNKGAPSPGAGRNVAEVSARRKKARKSNRGGKGKTGRGTDGFEG